MENCGAFISTYGIKEEKIDRFWGGTDDEFGFKHIQWKFMCRYLFGKLVVKLEIQLQE